MKLRPYGRKLCKVYILIHIGRYLKDLIVVIELMIFAIVPFRVRHFNWYMSADKASWDIAETFVVMSLMIVPETTKASK